LGAAHTGGQKQVFAFTQNPNAVSASAIVDVVDGANVLLTDSITGSGSTFANMVYSPFQQTFVADSSSASLQFTSTDPSFSNSGLALDAVSIQTVPEPAALALVSMAVFGICFWFALLHHKCALSPILAASRRSIGGGMDRLG
jgi:hypothetical protein